MNLISLYFPLFIFTATLGYWVLGKKVRIPFLLVCSYGFYCLSSWQYTLLLLLMTGVTYCFGRILEQCRRKGLLAAFIVAGFLPLLFLKLVLFPGVPFPVSGLVLPLGLTYYSFKSVGYLVDGIR